MEERGKAGIDVVIRAHGQGQGKCPECRLPCPGYDQMRARTWSQVALWSIPCYYHYGPRRIDCPEHGILVEHMPWNEGKRRMTLGFMAFLAMWARRMSWMETAGFGEEGGPDAAAARASYTELVSSEGRGIERGCGRT